MGGVARKTTGKAAGRKPTRRKRAAPIAGAAVAVTADAYEVAPAAPRSLGGEAGEYWGRIAPLLVARRALTPLHLEALEVLCDQWGQYRRLKVWLAADPKRWTVKTESGLEIDSVQARQLYVALKELQRLWAKFGLTPHAEPRLLPERGTGAKGREPSRLLEIAAEKTAHDEEQRPK